MLPGCDSTHSWYVFEKEVGVLSWCSRRYEWRASRSNLDQLSYMAETC